MIQEGSLVLYNKTFGVAVIRKNHHYCQDCILYRSSCRTNNGLYICGDVYENGRVIIFGESALINGVNHD